MLLLNDEASQKDLPPAIDGSFQNMSIRQAPPFAREDHLSLGTAHSNSSSPIEKIEGALKTPCSRADAGSDDEVEFSTSIDSAISKCGLLIEEAYMQLASTSLAPPEITESEILEKKDTAIWTQDYQQMEQKINTVSQRITPSQNRVFGIPELRCIILSHLPPHDLLRSIRVCKDFKASIAETTSLQRILCLAPMHKTPLKGPDGPNTLFINYLSSIGRLSQPEGTSSNRYLIAMAYNDVSIGFTEFDLDIEISRETLQILNNQPADASWRNMYLNQRPEKFSWRFKGRTVSSSFSMPATTLGVLVRKLLRAQTRIVHIQVCV